MKRNLPTRQLREHPDIDQLKRQAKELLASFTAADAAAIAEVDQHFPGAAESKFALHDAQLVIARAYGYDSWPKLKAFVDGANARRLREAVRAGEHDRVRSMLQVRPELAREALLDAVLVRAPEMVRILMQHGAHAHSGVYPHRDATSPFIIARERGYDEIVAIIQAEEQKRRGDRIPAPDELFAAIAHGQDERAYALLGQNPELVNAHSTHFGVTPLHMAAQAGNTTMAAWLLDRGADPNARARNDHTPLDRAAHLSNGDIAPIASLLLSRGASMTAAAAVALGDADWLRARHAEGALSNPIEDTGGLLRIAVAHDRPEILALLLGWGFDPDERIRFLAVGVDDVVFTWGMALYQAAGSAKYEMAEMLLNRGADPNASVYASGDPVFQAYSRGDSKMVELLERYGGIPSPSTAGLYRQTELARKMLAGEAKYREEPDGGGESFEQQLLWGAACGGDPEIVRMALARVEWARDDPRWFHLLEQPLRIWGPKPDSADWDRDPYLICFRLLLQRADPNLRGRDEFGLTILHSVAGSRPNVTPEQRVGFSTMLLDAGARLDLRDGLLKSTPLGWACRWGHVELVKLLLERGADPVESDAEPWATPRAWAEKMGHQAVLDVLGHTPPT